MAQSACARSHHRQLNVWAICDVMLTLLSYQVDFRDVVDLCSDEDAEVIQTLNLNLEPHTPDSEPCTLHPNF